MSKKRTRKISGIYLIENTKKEKSGYIGKSFNIVGRWSNERSCLDLKNGRVNRYLQNAWDKYGVQSFDFIILEDCFVEYNPYSDLSFRHQVDCELSRREQYWMDALRNEGWELYNRGGCARTPSLGSDRAEDLSGQKFGFLTALEKTERRTTNNHMIWKCLCDCGNQHFVDAYTLKIKGSISCGCYRKNFAAQQNTIDLSNQTFGLLTVLEKTNERNGNNVVWKCKCECGTICMAVFSRLRSGVKRSCGCLRQQARAKRFKNITNKRFGKLVVIEKTNIQKYHQVVWKCLCDCGNTAFVVGGSLSRGFTRSCGCMQGKKF